MLWKFQGPLFLELERWMFVQSIIIGIVVKISFPLVSPFQYFVYRNPHVYYKTGDVNRFPSGKIFYLLKPFYFTLWGVAYYFERCNQYIASHHNVILYLLFWSLWIFIVLPSPLFRIFYYVHLWCVKVVTLKFVLYSVLKNILIALA